jgi:hypothetical protein
MIHFSGDMKWEARDFITHHRMMCSSNHKLFISVIFHLKFSDPETMKSETVTKGRLK